MMSGVDMAQWDIRGKALGVSVYQLLGGKCRKSMRVPTLPRFSLHELLSTISAGYPKILPNKLTCRLNMGMTQ